MFKNNTPGQSQWVVKITTWSSYQNTLPCAVTKYPFVWLSQTLGREKQTKQKREIRSKQTFIAGWVEEGIYITKKAVKVLSGS